MLKKHWIFFVTLLVFLLLLAKNPFSVRTLIPNFEPYPDTIHYINPALSFIHGHGLQLFRDGRALQTNVPPLYSLVLSPIFLIKNDVRMFYIINILLAIGSFTFLYLILLKITKSAMIRFFALFLYATNFFIYWYPSLAMAENLTLFLFIAGIYLLTLSVTKKNVVLAAVISIGFYAVKYASIPLTGFYFLCYFVKIYLSFQGKNTKNEKTKGIIYLLILTCTAGITFLCYSYWEWTTKGTTLLVTLLSVFIPQKSRTLLSSGSWFSLQYLPTHLPEYLKAVRGGYKLRFLWDDTPIIPIFIGVPGMIGLFLGMLKKEVRLLSVSLVVLLLSSIVFMSTFYAVDMRYLYHAIPTLLIGFVLFWEIIMKTLDSRVRENDKKKLLKKSSLSSSGLTRGSMIVFTLLLVFLFFFYLATNIVRIKTQISTNLRYAETPWYYLSVVKLNEYFKEYKNKPYVISAMSPYYVDFFSSNNYLLLPMSPSQDFFRMGTAAVWGKENYSDLKKLYIEKIGQGKEVYMVNYLGNDENIRKDVDKIRQDFVLTLVSEGCYGSCNIWKVNIK